MSSSNTETKINENIDKASNRAHEEVTRLRAELDDLKRRAGPKMHEAETFLTSPTALGFYQGLAVGVVMVLGYAKWNGGIQL
ncbi:hypothetical protein O0I10_005443 [Lichtheimia ornata]|uniref:Uncharacterized protein n=1 Tax=Lichtheimia ornata TaxID=688661 RepID=A0AAD7V3N7_9FUNG|nr:uncharacterized protein O0I10_005443 [Lichtheimia ornata]KAJ8658719.1 hypothetical protein O0I10_005443 [Lichtheimia ornata]